MLNDTGQVVGLVHRGPTSVDLFTSNSANVFSIATAASYLTPALTAPLPVTTNSISSATTASTFIANNILYLNARISSVIVDGTPASPLTLLGAACDAALARHDFTSPEALADALAPCYDAQLWIECRADAPAVAYGTLCPSGSEVTAWYNRFKAVSQQWQDMTGQPDYSTVASGIASLQPTFASGMTSGGMQLSQMTSALSSPLDLSLAYYLAAFNIGSYGSVTISDYLRSYTSVPYYALSGSEIAYGLAWLYATNRLSKEQLATSLTALAHDPLIDTGTRLSVEELQYQFSLL